MDMTFSNKAMQPLSNFGIQFNKNSFGVAPAQPLNVPAISPNQSVDVSLPLNTSGPVQKMDPLTNLQVKKFIPFVLPTPWVGQFWGRVLSLELLSLEEFTGE